MTTFDVNNNVKDWKKAAEEGKWYNLYYSSSVYNEKSDVDDRFKEWNEAISEYDCAKSVFDNAIIGPQIDVAIALMKNCECRLEITKTRIGLIGDLTQMTCGYRDPFEYELVDESETLLSKMLSKIKIWEVLHGKIKIWSKKIQKR